MAATERVNLNLPADARERLRELARAANKPEAVYARSLLVKAIDRAERAAFRERLEASRTPQRRARDLEIATALEKLNG
jgi:predicted DNA-binding protein